jgi:exodeoxyribonuclease-3
VSALVATANLNGVRAAQRRGLGAWLEAAHPHILAVQEVRADTSDLVAALPDWTVAHAPSVLPGRAGVAITAAPGVVIGEIREGLDLAAPELSGRWIEAEIALPDRAAPLTVASAYVPVGEVGTLKQAAKYAFLGAMTTRMGELAAAGGDVIVCGDINIGHREADIKNWRGNVGKRGFLPAERAHIDTWLGEQGWVDVGRALAGDVPGPYTWWSWRGSAFDRDTGWRIDCQYATPGLAARATSARVDRAPTYAERWSDHAPLVVVYS